MPQYLVQKWEQYLREISRVDVVADIKIEDFRGDSVRSLEVNSESESTVRRLDEGFHVESKYISRDGKTVVENKAANKNYSFAISKVGDDPIQLKEVDAESPTDLLFEESSAAKTVCSHVFGPIGSTVPGVTLIDIFNHPSFRMLKTTRTAIGNWEIQIDFRLSGEHFWLSGPGVIEVQGSGFMLPVNLIMQGGDQNCEGEIAVKSRYENAVQMPRAVSIEQLDILKCEGERYIHRRDFSITWRDANLNDSDFLRLSTYGLPEPRRPSHINWWYVIGGLLLLAGAYQLISRREQWTRT
ncbi:MAG: hypothetical protein KDA80_24790 [Planctomycetaceae bacterium]|nr:hypothetical protein [Planctomycetaceae bacterium]